MASALWLLYRITAAAPAFSGFATCTSQAHVHTLQQSNASGQEFCEIVERTPVGSPPVVSEL
jgi:hypothetical protein